VLRLCVTCTRAVLLRMQQLQTCACCRLPAAAATSCPLPLQQVRINLDDSDAPSDLRERCISVGGGGALQVLQAIAHEMQAMSN